MKKTFALAILPLFIAGCATSKYSITYDSFPQSATVVCNNAQRGYTPLRIYYRSVEELNMFANASCKAVWPSGAEAMFNQLYSADNSSRHMISNAERPNTTTGLQNDVQFDYQKKADDQRRRDRIRAQEQANQIREENLRLERDWLRLEEDRQRLREAQYRDRKDAWQQKQNENKKKNKKPKANTGSAINQPPSTTNLKPIEKNISPLNNQNIGKKLMPL